MEWRLFCRLPPSLLQVYVNSISFTRLHNAFLNLETVVLHGSLFLWGRGPCLINLNTLWPKEKLTKGHSFGHLRGLFVEDDMFSDARNLLSWDLDHFTGLKESTKWGFKNEMLEATVFDQGSWLFWICRSPIYLPKVILPPFGNKILCLVTARPQRWSIWSILQGLAYVGFAFCVGISSMITQYDML